MRKVHWGSRWDNDKARGYKSRFKKTWADVRRQDLAGAATDEGKRGGNETVPGMCKRALNEMFLTLLSGTSFEKSSKTKR